nr:lymphocyte antigen 6 complex, locus A-like isoform X4 [Rattus norvegicus]
MGFQPLLPLALLQPQVVSEGARMKRKQKMNWQRMNSSCAMMSCVLIFLLALLCAERAQGLKCYNCLGIPFDYTCSSTATCPYPDGVCAIQVAEVVAL